MTAALRDHAGGPGWSAEIRLYLKRTLKRLDVSIALDLRPHRARLLFSRAPLPSWPWARTAPTCSRARARGRREGRDAATDRHELRGLSHGQWPESRLASRFLDEPGRVDELKRRIGEDLEARAAGEGRSRHFTPDDIDWRTSARGNEARAAFSPTR